MLTNNNVKRVGDFMDNMEVCGVASNHRSHGDELYQDTTRHPNDSKIMSFDQFNLDSVTRRLREALEYWDEDSIEYKKLMKKWGYMLNSPQSWKRKYINAQGEEKSSNGFSG